jgi:hypothetical protein
MKRLITEWLWRATLFCALAWIGWELHEIRLEMQRPVEDQTTADADPDPLQESLDALRDDVATLNEKVDAMMVAMMQLKR